MATEPSYTLDLNDLSTREMAEIHRTTADAMRAGALRAKTCACEEPCPIPEIETVVHRCLYCGKAIA